MADGTGIEWTDATWNPIVGCSLVSPGCTHCYAMGQASRITLMAAGAGKTSHYDGTTKPSKSGPVWTGKVKLAPEHILLQPPKWQKSRRIFVNSMGDLFHEDVPDAWIDRVFAIIALSPQHTFQILTKRAARMRAYFAETWQPAPARTVLLGGEAFEIPADKRPGDRWDQINAAIDEVTSNALFDQDRFWTPEGSLIGRPAWPRQPLPNVWLGVSTEDQRRADERVPDLLATPAAVRFISAEPLIGRVQLHSLPLETRAFVHHQALRGETLTLDGDYDGEAAKLDWVIVGGESGPDARPMHPDWARDLRDQCAAAGTAFFFKQWGAWAPLHRSAPVIEAGGRTLGVAWPDGTIGPGHADLNGGDGASLYLASKAVAGRLLDGVEHNAMPEVRA